MRECKQKYPIRIPKKAYQSKLTGGQSTLFVPPLSYEDFDGIPKEPLPPKENYILNIFLKYLPKESIAFHKFCYGFCQLCEPVVEELSDKFNKKVASYKGNLYSDSDGVKRSDKIAKGFEHIQMSLNLVKSEVEDKKNKITNKDLISTSYAMGSVLSHLKVIKDEFASWDI